MGHGCIRLVALAAPLVLWSCAVKVPRAPRVEIAVQVKAKAKARVEADARARGEVVRAEPPAPVELVGAEVVEFFGIPLDDAREIVFVLDRSGSMSEPATGRIAQIDTTAPPPGAPEPPPPIEPPADSGDIRPPPPPAPDQGPPPPDTVDLAPAAPAPAPPPPRKIDVARSELVDALARLPAGTRVNVIYFNSQLEAFAPAIFTLDDSGRAALVEFVTETAPSGSTALAPAMRTAFLMNPRRIVLLSDGLGNVGGRARDVLRDAREAMLGGVRIDTIGLGRQNAHLLQTLANESGGLYQGL